MNTILVSKFNTTINERLLAPAGNVLSNRLLEDLERLWQLRDILPSESGISEAAGRPGEFEGFAPQ